MKTSDAGIEFITLHEGVVYVPYKDQAGLPTVGVGHLLKPGDPFNRPITRDEAQQLLRADLSEAEAAINRYVSVSLNQNQVDALVSLIFNIGAGAFQSSTLLNRLNAGDFKGAAEAFLSWNKITLRGKKVVSNGLMKRRQAEKALFETPA